MQKILLPASHFVAFLALLFVNITSLRAQTWNQVVKATAEYSNGTSARSTNAQYGFSVAISGNYAIVGARSDGTNANGIDNLTDAGAAYILVKDNNTWKYHQKIVAPIRATADYFGYSVAISGDYAVVGAALENEDANNTNTLMDPGAAYIYKKNPTGSWVFVRKIAAPQRDINDIFGEAVAISGDYVVVGSLNESQDTAEANYIYQSGSAYVFRKDQGGTDNWGLVRKLTAPVRTLGDHFGASVSVDGNYIVVGASEEDEDTTETNSITDAGAAYIFQKDLDGSDNWGFVKKITADQRNPSVAFGTSVSIKGAYLIVGAQGEPWNVDHTSALSNGGAAYVFKRDETGNWGMIRKITSSDRDHFDNFGAAVSITDGYAVVGAYLKSENGGLFNTGAAYIFEKDRGGADNWGESKKLSPSVSGASDFFATSVAIDGENALIGAPQEDEDSTQSNTITDAGAAYIFSLIDPLPVSLVSFRVEKAENAAHLIWGTTAETNTNRFEIQKSADAHSWRTIGAEAAAGESHALLIYEFYDRQPTEPRGYYRLKMIDHDGTFAYSSIRYLSSDQSAASIFAFPNPASDQLFIKNIDIVDVSNVRIVNSAGQTVFVSSQTGNEGISLQNFNSGNYVVFIATTAGTIIARKLVVKH